MRRADHHEVLGQDRWSRRVVIAALRRLPRHVATRIRVFRCRIQRRGETLIVLVEGQPELASPSGPVPEQHTTWTTGRGAALWSERWLPGDPRLTRNLQLALAHALADMAENSGLGLHIWRSHWRSDRA